ncbi:MAG: response regulator [Acidobacteriia bacterium]|nr:response regulator [Terriglobia bacterium]
MRAVIVDDEELARGFLREMLRAHPEIEIAAECANGFEAVKAIAEFLDIQMPKLDGFEVLELIDPGPAVVFVTVGFGWLTVVGRELPRRTLATPPRISFGRFPLRSPHRRPLLSRDMEKPCRLCSLRGSWSYCKMADWPRA